MSKLIDTIIINESADKDKIYLISLATPDEILLGDYIEINGIKLSANPKKHGVITNVKIG